MQKRNLFPLLIPLVFGIPFLLISDLFPFHRFGMFARHSSAPVTEETRILLAVGDTLMKLESGSPCLDRGLFPQLASHAINDEESAGVLLEKLRTVLNPFPDSVFVEQESPEGCLRKKIFPRAF